MEFHKHDQDWAVSLIRNLPYQYQQKAMEGYKQVYDEAYGAEPVQHKKSNAARKAANTRLRLFCERVNNR